MSDDAHRTAYARLVEIVSDDDLTSGDRRELRVLILNAEDLTDLAGRSDELHSIADLAGDLTPLAKHGAQITYVITQFSEVVDFVIADAKARIEEVTFKYQGVGSLGRPRFPSFVGIRRDL